MITPPSDIPGQGRYAAVRDPEGNEVGLLSRTRRCLTAPRRQPLPPQRRPVRGRRGPGRRRRPGWPASSASSSRAGTSPRPSARSRCVERFAWLDAAVGVHPARRRQGRRRRLGEHRRLGADPRVVAIGETGLDYDRVFSPIPDQLANLRRNLALALETGKPAILHCRSAAGRRDAPGRPRRRAAGGRGRRAGVGRRVRGPAAGRHPLVLRAGRLRAGGHRPRARGQLLGARLPRGGGAIGRGRRDRARRPRPHRDRFAVPCATRRAALAKRTRVGARHRGMGRRPTRDDTGRPRRGPRRGLRPDLPERAEDRRDAIRSVRFARRRRRSSPVVACGSRRRRDAASPARRPSPAPTRPSSASRGLEPAAPSATATPTASAAALAPRPRRPRAPWNRQTGLLPSDRMTNVEILRSARARCRPVQLR